MISPSKRGLPAESGIESIFPRAKESSRDNDVQNFQEEFQRLLRAFLESKDIESRAHSQLRMLKELILEQASKIKVASLLTELETSSTTDMRGRLTELEAKTHASKRQEAEAAATIDNLKVEISALRRTIREINAGGKRSGTGTATKTDNIESATIRTQNSAGVIADELPHIPSSSQRSKPRSRSPSPLRNLRGFLRSSPSPPHPGTALTPLAFSEIANAADAEVDALYARLRTGHDPDLPGGGTLFQEWKVKNFQYSEDTPKASENYDDHMVQMLAAATLRDSLVTLRDQQRGRGRDSGLDKHTTSMLGKVKVLPLTGGIRVPDATRLSQSISGPIKYRR